MYYKGEKHYTRLAAWVEEQGLSAWAVARDFGVDVKTVEWWMQNTKLPDLIHAFLIERKTQGAVPAVYWLDTPLGLYRQRRKKNWEATDEANREASKRKYAMRKSQNEGA